MTFKIYNCEFGFKKGGVDYKFPNVAEVQIEDPERNRLTRGANATDKLGIVYKDGLKDPKKMTIPVLQMSTALKAALDDAFLTQARCDVYCVDRSDGSAKWAKNAVLCNYPQQLSIDESAESMNVSLEWETFEAIENHKS